MFECAATHAHVRKQPHKKKTHMTVRLLNKNLNSNACERLRTFIYINAKPSPAVNLLNKQVRGLSLLYE